MFLYLLLLLGGCHAASDEDYMEQLSADVLTYKEQTFKRIKFTPQERTEIQKTLQLSDIFNEGGTPYHDIKKYIVDGNLKKGITFNIFDDEINAAVQALYDLVQSLKDEQVEIFQIWAEKHIDKEMFDYVCRLNILYSNKTIINKSIHKEPPYLMKPNYYVNSEAIVKALKVGLRMFSEDEEFINEIDRFDDLTIIYSNNSGWNLVNNGCDEELTYFREDIGLNSYYYGLHLLHPFWMPFEKLDKINPRHAEHYYFAHQQLLARYLLEREHLDEEFRPMTVDCKNTFDPYLIYDNGLPFPSTKKIAHQMDTEEAEIKQIDILLKECIARGVLISEPGTVKNVSDLDGLNSIARFVLKNLDSFIIAKKIRDVYGGQPKVEYIDHYNPAPSILYNYQTALRDSVYWGILDYAMLYFSEYKSVIPPFDISLYNEKEIRIDSAVFPKLLTLFEDYQFSVSDYLNNNHANNPDSETQDILISRKRLTHRPFHVSLNVMSHFRERIVNVKMFLGPQCYKSSCWEQYNRFFQLDTFNIKLLKGLNSITWDPEGSSRFSFDDHFNKNYYSKSNITFNRYNFFKFPKHLLLPKGSKEGTNMTLFIMMNSIQSEEEFDESSVPLGKYYYNKILYTYDKKPLGFPFHKRAINFENGSTNYNFFNVTIYHDS